MLIPDALKGTKEGEAVALTCPPESGVMRHKCRNWAVMQSVKHWHGSSEERCNSAGRSCQGETGQKRQCSGWFWKVRVKVAQSCPTLCYPMDYTVHGILQARILEWVAFPFTRRSSQPRDRTQVSHIAGGFFTSWVTREATSEAGSEGGFIMVFVRACVCVCVCVYASAHVCVKAIHPLSLNLQIWSWSEDQPETDLLILSANIYRGTISASPQDYTVDMIMLDATGKVS